VPEAEIGYAEQGKAQNKGQTEGCNHKKSNQGRNESEKLVTDFVKNRIQEGQFVSIPENSKVSKGLSVCKQKLFCVLYIFTVNKSVLSKFLNARLWAF